MTFGYIYKIQFPNGKNYIGLTTSSLEKRKNEHKYSAKRGDTRCLYNALRKYDMEDTFELIEIDTADTLDELCENEKTYIKEYNSYYMNGNGYNMTYGGEGTNGYVFTEEDNQKNSEKRKKYFQEHPEEFQRMKEMRKQQLDNPEMRKQMTESMKKHWENPEATARQSEITKQHHNDHPETRLRQSESRKTTFENNPEIRERQSEKMKKMYKDNPEARKKNSEAVKKHWENNSEAKERFSETSKKQWENPEARARQSEKKKQYFKDHPEEIEKNREKQKNRSPEWIKKRCDTMGQNKPFDVFTKDGIFIKTFTYIFEAREYLQKEYNVTSKINITKVLQGVSKTASGFVFKYK